MRTDFLPSGETKANSQRQDPKPNSYASWLSHLSWQVLKPVLIETVLLLPKTVPWVASCGHILYYKTRFP